MDFKRVTGYFLIQGFGVILEAAWMKLWRIKGRRSDERKAPGHEQATSNGQANGTSSSNGHGHAKVDASPAAKSASDKPRQKRSECGRAWTAFWVIIPTQIMAEAWLLRGIAAVHLFPNGWSPAKLLLSNVLPGFKS